jgi:Molybdopterin biosynthesis enzyme
MMTFEQLVRPALLKMSGHPNYGRPVVQAIFQEAFSKRTDRRHFLRGVLTREDGVFMVRTTGAQGSGILTSMVKANCLIDIPVEVERVSPGDLVSVQLLTGEVWASSSDPGQTGITSPAAEAVGEALSKAVRRFTHE